MSQQAPQVLSLDDLYVMTASIYSEQNAERAASATFSHFVEVCGLLASLHTDKDDKVAQEKPGGSDDRRRGGLAMEDALCKALGWYFPLMAKFRVKSVEQLVFRKYPRICPYCGYRQHVHDECKTAKPMDNVDVKKLESAHKTEKAPHTLGAWQQMFQDIYPRTSASYRSRDSVVCLFEELGELAEAVRVFERHPKYFAGEAADVFSYLMGLANEHQRRPGRARAFDFEAEYLARYPGLCLQCGHGICICPMVPESTVQRQTKELDLPPVSSLFDLRYDAMMEDGSEQARSALARVGGLAAVGTRLPIDRGETNQALLILCIRLAEELRPKNPDLASRLEEAASRAASERSQAGSREHSKSSLDLVSVLRDVWPLLRLASVPDEPSLAARIGSALRQQTVQIAIVTALPEEYAAMKAMLDEAKEDAPIPGDPYRYLLGTIPASIGNGAHLVLMTLCSMGNNASAIAATHLLRSYPSVSDVVMVGVAGGIPNLQDANKHVRLGDIAVSSDKGVLQYDNLKLEQEKITLRGTTNRPSRRLLQAMDLLKAEWIAHRHPWESHIPVGLQLEGAARPGDDQDAEFEHPADAERRPGLPKVHYGRIGASNVLLKDPVVRDRLGSQWDVRAVEMEGSGIQDATDIGGKSYLVVRGIMDYCDGKKADAWKQYAAVVAAAFARALISSLPVPGAGER